MKGGVGPKSLTTRRRRSLSPPTIELFAFGLIAGTFLSSLRSFRRQGGSITGAGGMEADPAKGGVMMMLSPSHSAGIPDQARLVVGLDLASTKTKNGGLAAAVFNPDRSGFGGAAISSSKSRR
jgi:hypothetical protein